MGVGEGRIILIRRKKEINSSCLFTSSGKLILLIYIKSDVYESVPISNMTESKLKSTVIYNVDSIGNGVFGNSEVILIRMNRLLFVCNIISNNVTIYHDSAKITAENIVALVGPDVTDVQFSSGISMMIASMEDITYNIKIVYMNHNTNNVKKHTGLWLYDAHSHVVTDMMKIHCPNRFDLLSKHLQNMMILKPAMEFVLITNPSNFNDLFRHYDIISSNINTIVIRKTEDKLNRRYYHIPTGTNVTIISYGDKEFNAVTTEQFPACIIASDMIKVKKIVSVK